MKKLTTIFSIVFALGFAGPSLAGDKDDAIKASFVRDLERSSTTTPIYTGEQREQDPLVQAIRLTLAKVSSPGRG